MPAPGELRSSLTANGERHPYLPAQTPLHRGLSKLNSVSQDNERCMFLGMVLVSDGCLGERVSVQERGGVPRCGRVPVPGIVPAALAEPVHSPVPLWEDIGRTALSMVFVYRPERK